MGPAGPAGPPGPPGSLGNNGTIRDPGIGILGSVGAKGDKV